MLKNKLILLASLLFIAPLLTFCASPKKARVLLPPHLVGIHVQKRDEMGPSKNDKPESPLSKFSFFGKKPDPSPSQNNAAPLPSRRGSSSSGSGDGIRLPDMESMPGESELRSSGKGSAGSNPVISRPPAE